MLIDYSFKHVGIVKVNYPSKVEMMTLMEVKIALNNSCIDTIYF